MLLFSCGMKKGHFPPNLVKNTIFCPYICVLLMEKQTWIPGTCSNIK